MGDKSNIEWTDATWNPIRARNLKTGKVGWHCEHATTGCEFCYAEGFNKRLGTGLPFKPGHRADIEIFLDEQMLLAPLRWKKPRMIFVCSMTDLFADFVTDEWLARIFSIIGTCDDRGLGHTFQVLTKRAERQQKWVAEYGRKYWNGGRIGPSAWPARNIWLGVSAERQQEADERIPLLLQTPAAVRFVSAEPLLGPIDLTDITDRSIAIGEHHFSALPDPDDEPGAAYLDWVIVGGESGPNARRMDARWARDLRDQCRISSTPFFFKQWGQHDPDTWDRVGKKAAGRVLDGREWNEMPGRAPA